MFSIQLQIEQYICWKLLVFVEENKRCTEQKKTPGGGTGMFAFATSLYHYYY